MNFNSIFDSLPVHSSKYLEFYFRDMIKLPKNKKIFFNASDKYALAIMKDETKRVLSGSGKLRERPWSNFLFYFMNKDTYIELFGINKRRRNVLDKKILSDEFTLSEWDESYNGKDPDGINVLKANNYKIAKFLFDLIKIKEPFLFVRSYVYITIIIYDDSEIINTDNYLTYYFNTNYKFTETNGKKDFIYNVAYSYLVDDINFELELIKDNNRDIIDCAKAFIGDFDFIDQTKYYFDNLVQDIEKGDKYILVEGAARTGKTIIAMSLLQHYEDAQLLVMNYYFYNALKDAFATLDYNFPKERVFHQSYGKSGYYDGIPKMDFTFCIVDECQRFGNKFGLIDRITGNPNHKHSIFLGDDYQRLRSSSDDGLKYILDRIIETENSVKKYKFNNSIGVPPWIVKNVKFLLNAPEMKNPYPIGEYIINIYDTQNDFLKAYEKDSLSRKHLATIQAPYTNFKDFGKYRAFPKSLINTSYPYFLNKETINNYYFSPYEMISRELDSMYIFVRRNISEESITEYVLTQLYILMTRATISLNLFFENQSTKKFFKLKLEKIMEFSHMETFNLDEIEEGRQFFVKEDIVDEVLLNFSINNPKPDLKSRFITRLLHFTDEKNIDSILKYGILPRENLVSNAIDYVFNDENRIDGYPDSICLSVENPNDRLLKAFKQRFPERKFKLITINPAILYSSFIMNGDRLSLTKRLYCNYNAAAKRTLKSADDIKIMYSEVVQTYWLTYTRHNLPENMPTSSQAEILFFGIIPPEFIDTIEDI